MGTNLLIFFFFFLRENEISILIEQNRDDRHFETCLVWQVPLMLDKLQVRYQSNGERVRDGYLLNIFVNFSVYLRLLSCCKIYTYFVFKNRRYIFFWWWYIRNWTNFPFDMKVLSMRFSILLIVYLQGL